MPQVDVVSAVNVGTHVRVHLVERFAKESALPTQVFLRVLEPTPPNVAPVTRIDLSAAQGGGAEQPLRPPRRDIRFCIAPDGARIAFATTGSGYPLVKPPIG